MTHEDMAERDARVLEHVTRYPGLSAFEIARALGWVHPNHRWGYKARVEQSLMRLLLNGQVTFETVPWPAPGGMKRIWMEKNMAKIPARDEATQALQKAKDTTRETEYRTVAALVGIGYAILEVADSVRDRTWEITRSLKQ